MFKDFWKSITFSTHPNHENGPERILKTELDVKNENMFNKLYIEMEDREFWDD